MFEGLLVLASFSLNSRGVLHHADTSRPSAVVVYAGQFACFLERRILGVIAIGPSRAMRRDFASKRSCCSRRFHSLGTSLFYSRMGDPLRSATLISRHYAYFWKQCILPVCD